MGLASDTGLDYTDAAEILFLLERLERVIVVWLLSIGD